MLNHRGGWVLFSVEPDGRIIGQMVSDRTVEDVAQELGEIEPPVFPSVERVDVAEGRQLLIEAWGRGTIEMEELTVRAGLPRPEIIETAGCVMVRFSPKVYVPPQRVAQNVTERQQRVLAVLSTSAEGLALRDIRKGLGEEIPEWELKNELAALKHLGLVQTRGYARGARWILS